MKFLTKTGAVFACTLFSGCATMTDRLGLYDPEVKITAKGLVAVLQNTVEHEGACSIEVRDSASGEGTEFVTQCIGDERYDKAVQRHLARVEDPDAPTFKTSVWAPGWDTHLNQKLVRPRTSAFIRDGEGRLVSIAPTEKPTLSDIKRLANTHAHPAPAPATEPSSAEPIQVSYQYPQRNFARPLEGKGSFVSELISAGRTGRLPPGFSREPLEDIRRNTQFIGDMAIRGKARILAPDRVTSAIEYEVITLSAQVLDEKSFYTSLLTQDPIDFEVTPSGFVPANTRATLFIVERGSYNL